MATTNLTERWGERANYKEAAADADKKLFIKSGEACGFGEEPDGVSVQDLEKGLPYTLHKTGDVTVAGAGTIAAGDDVMSNAIGKAMKFVPNNVTKAKADTTQRTTIVLADDPELKDISLAINQLYKIKASLRLKNNHNSAQTFQAKFTVPSGAAAKGNIFGGVESTNLLSLNAVDATLTNAFTQAIAASSEALLNIDGILDVGTTAGLLSLQWANDSTTGVDTIDVLEGSILEIENTAELKKAGKCLEGATDGDILVNLKLG